MNEDPKAWTIFLSKLISESSGGDQVDPLLLKDREVAASIRERIAAQINLFDGPQLVVLDLGGSAFTPSALQELILPLAQRIRGGEHGTVRLVIRTDDPGIEDFIRYMAQARQLPLYLSNSPSNFLWEGTPAGNLTSTERSTLDTIVELGGRVTASRLADAESIKPSAATNRLANLDRSGYLIRQPRGRREGDFYIEPRSSTAPPLLEGPLVVSESSTGPGRPAW